MATSPPRIIARRGGRAIKKILRSIRFSRGRGGVPIDGTRNTTPAASVRRLRTIFLVTPPPLLAAMRGGEIRSFQNETPNHIPLSRPRSTRLSTTSAILTWTDVPREEGGCGIKKYRRSPPLRRRRGGHLQVMFSV